MRHVHAFRDDALGEFDAVGVARRIASGEVSAREVLDASLARLDAVNPQLNAVAVDDRDRAVARADGSFGGVFAGVPSAVKNNTAFAGIATRNGSAATPDVKASENEPFADQLVETGLNMIGATTTPAYGLTATTEFVDRDPTRNPWDTDFSSGASSGGAAALVASGVLPIAHANDGGGSIRIPAAACGLVGFKPTRGRTAPAEMAKSLPIDLVSNGVVTRSVRDSAAFLADVERRHPAAGMPAIGDVQGPGDKRLRIALVNAPITGGLLDRDTDKAVNGTVELLESLGHRVTTVPLPVDRSFIDDFSDYWALMAFGIDRLGRFTIGKGFDNSQIDPFTRGLSNRFARRFYRTPLAIRGLHKGTAAFRSLFDDFDVVLSPTLAHVTPEIGVLSPAGDFDEVFAKLVDYVSFTPANNVSGTPAVSLPLAQTSTGLPIGIHFSADLGDERTLLELSYELEAARPFARIQSA
ncbi:amidase [Gordonia spumicola]|uniref:amidase n=1 Tax=Gordonia spumicola TaxID=589161 RepID=A0A7I9V8D2_9ACTN|nr:amidase [Gordonia spumicola]GEE01353.1 amidase [Gordonia spumicola]